MNEEEKEVVKLLQHCQNTYIEDTLVTHLQLTTEEAKILLNLVEKQQKEIERLKDEYKREVFEYQEFVEDTKVAVQDYIKKDKIKEKIKELENHNWKDGYMSKFDKYAIHYLEELLSGQESDQEGGQEDE